MHRKLEFKLMWWSRKVCEKDLLIIFVLFCIYLFFHSQSRNLGPLFEVVCIRRNFRDQFTGHFTTVTR